MNDKLKIHCLQHVPYEGLAQIQAWIDEKGHALTFTRFFENQRLPAADTFDWLIIMGGPMGVNDTEKFPWMGEEKELISTCIEKNKTILGICLGAQLIASVLGAKVFPNQQKEIGWYPVQNPVFSSSVPPVFQISESLNVFHWHGDTFELPQGALHLYKSEACENQGFLYNNNVLGLQFHFEVTVQSMAGMVKHGKKEITEGGKYVQPANSILENHQHFFTSHQHIYKILDYLAD